MPNKLLPNKIKTWWQQRFNNKQDTLDWRSLSPDHPPLPFLSPETLPSTIINSSILQMESSPIQHHSSIMIATNSSHKARKDQPITTPLFPILEESETMVTEESCSNVNQNTTTIQRSPETSSTCSTPSFHPPTSLSILDCVGDEDKCKQLFARMIVEMRQDHAKPSHLSLSFDTNGNIHTLHMLIQGQVNHQKFDGVSQCLPPEVMNNHYNSEKADVWMLGIHLYKLLTGKYPFYASNDQQLFKKMLHTNFSIPNELSEGNTSCHLCVLHTDIYSRC
ncbi:hypothetical protein RMCBS344292_04825 [Rhizopus microsporus]|nr:hypothetical protein RMCBS344292_04825 [Rhizopus microsporus]